MTREYTNFNVKIDSQVYEEMKNKVKDHGMNLTSFLKLAIRNIDLLLTIDEENNEKINEELSSLIKRVKELEKNMGKIDVATLSELSSLYKKGMLSSSNNYGNSENDFRGFSFEED
ncbi:MAG: hypothetical protein HQK84_08745 [Nitrospinae bacterium]|nr:hypothetical protein [Nitrospinota bacterium]